MQVFLKTLTGKTIIFDVEKMTIIINLFKINIILFNLYLILI